MKPLPKYVGILSALATVFAGLNAAGVFSVLPPKASAIVVGIGALLTTLSHSLTGTGGAPAL